MISNQKIFYFVYTYAYTSDIAELAVKIHVFYLDRTFRKNNWQLKCKKPYHKFDPNKHWKEKMQNKCRPIYMKEDAH